MLLDISFEKPTTLHLSSEDIAGYVDRRLPPPDRQRVEAHLAECDQCRTEVVEVARIAGKKPPAKGLWAIGVAAAAAVVLFAVVEPRIQRDDTVSDSLRAPDRLRDAESILRIDVVAPTGGSTVNPDSIVLVWRRAGADLLYRLTVTGTDGRVIWSDSTSDTTLLVPPAAGLRRSQPYYWYADVIHPDGRSATTGVQRFRTAP